MPSAPAESDFNTRRRAGSTGTGARRIASAGGPLTGLRAEAAGLAAFYLGDATAFWKIAEANDVMLPEALSEVDVLAIPYKS